MADTRRSWLADEVQKKNSQKNTTVTTKSDTATKAGEYDDPSSFKGVAPTTGTTEKKPAAAAPVVTQSQPAAVTTTEKEDNRLAELYERQIEALEEAKAEQERALRSAYNQNVNTLGVSADDAKRQAYIAKRKAMKELPAAMAAGGHTGGVTETTAGTIETEYLNALTDIDEEKAAALAQLQSDLAAGVASNAQGYLSQIAAAEASAAEAMQKQLAAKGNTGTSAQSGAKAFSPTMTYTQIVNELENGNASDLVRQNAAAVGVDVNRYQQMSQYEAFQQLNNLTRGSTTETQDKLALLDQWYNQGKISPEVRMRLAQIVTNTYEKDM